MDSLKCYVLRSGKGFVAKKRFGGYEKTMYFSTNCLFMAHEDPEGVAEKLSGTYEFRKNIEIVEFSLVQKRVLVSNNI